MRAFWLRGWKILAVSLCVQFAFIASGIAIHRIAYPIQRTAAEAASTTQVSGPLRGLRATWSSTRFDRLLVTAIHTQTYALENDFPLGESPRAVMTQDHLPVWSWARSNTQLSRKQIEDMHERGFGWPLPLLITRSWSSRGPQTSEANQPIANWATDLASTRQPEQFSIWWSGLLVNTVTWLVIVLVAWSSLALILRRIRSRRVGRCVTCGYALAGLAICPECGAANP